MVAFRHVKWEKASLPVDERHSQTSLLKFAYSQYCCILHVASVYIPFCMVLCVVGSCCAKFETVQTFSCVQTDATTPTEADKLQYADQCSRVRQLLKSSKMSYYASLINENKSDSKVLFNTIDRMLHRTPQNHYPSCGSPKELCDKFADFFCDKIVTIRNQLDTLSITDAPVFPLIDDAIIKCELSEFSPTLEDELSGLGKKNRRQIVFS